MLYVYYCVSSDVIRVEVELVVEERGSGAL